jgi:hypothetical protein
MARTTATAALIEGDAITDWPCALRAGPPRTSSRSLTISAGGVLQASNLFFVVVLFTG